MPAAWRDRHPETAPVTGQALVNRVLEGLTGLELRLFGRRDLELLAGPGIARLGRTAIGDREGPEADQTHLITTLQGRGDGVEDAVDGFRRVGLRQASCAGYLRNQIVLVHLRPPRSMVRMGEPQLRHAKNLRLWENARQCGNRRITSISGPFLTEKGCNRFAATANRLRHQRLNA